MNVAQLVFQAIGALSALVACIGIAVAARQLRFNCWLKAQEIFTEDEFVEARRKVYSRLPGRTCELPKEWTPHDHLVSRKMDELVRLAPYLGLFGAGKRLILKTWDDPLAKSWIALRPLVEKEQERWPKKWHVFEEFGKKAAAQLNLAVAATENTSQRRVHMTAIDLFERWFGKAIDKLRELPEGDGALAALMISIPLYERFVVAKLTLDGKKADDVSIQREIGDDLDMNDGQRRVFWEMFRNGFMHEAMAKGGKTKWMIRHDFAPTPKFTTVDGIQYVCFDPWKFSERVIEKFRKDPRLITASESFPFASIFSLPPDIVSDNTAPTAGS